MARARFLGPEGSRFAGLELRMVRPGGGRIRDLAAVQHDTGLKMADLLAEMSANEAFALQVVIFLTLRNAGQFVTFDEAGGFAEDEIDWIQEAGDLPDKEPATPDPTSARTATAPGAAPGPHPAKAPAKKRSRPKASSPGSTTRSATGS